MRGAVLDDLSDKLSQGRCRRLHGLRRRWQRSGAKHVIRACPDQHQLVGLEASVGGHIARYLLVDGHFDIADHVNEKIVQVGRRLHCGAALCIAEAALRVSS